MAVAEYSYDSYMYAAQAAKKSEAESRVQPGSFLKTPASHTVTRDGTIHVSRLQATRRIFSFDCHPRRRAVARESISGELRCAHLIFWPGRVVSLRTSLITSVKIAVRVATGLDLFSDVLMALLFAPARKEVWVAAHSPAAPPSPFIVKAVVDVIAGGAGSHPKWRHRSGSTVCLQD